MQLSEIITVQVETVGPDTTLQCAAQKMAMLDIGILPVTENDRVVGVITDRDIIVRAIANGFDPIKYHVREAMTEEVVCLFEDEDILDAAKLMMKNQVRRLPIVNRANRLVGIVSLADLTVYGKELAGQVLEHICEPQALMHKIEMALHAG